MENLKSDNSSMRLRHVDLQSPLIDVENCTVGVSTPFSRQLDDNNRHSNSSSEDSGVHSITSAKSTRSDASLDNEPIEGIAPMIFSNSQQYVPHQYSYPFSQYQRAPQYSLQSFSNEQQYFSQQALLPHNPNYMAASSMYPLMYMYGPPAQTYWPPNAQTTLLSQQEYLNQFTTIPSQRLLQDQRQSSRLPDNVNDLMLHKNQQALERNSQKQQSLLNNSKSSIQAVDLRKQNFENRCIPAEKLKQISQEKTSSKESKLQKQQLSLTKTKKSSQRQHTLLEDLYTELTALTSQKLPSKTGPRATAKSISEKNLSRIQKYHDNMVRKHPQKERTVKEQERRDKNTAACQISRRKTMLSEALKAQEILEMEEEQEEVMGASLRAAAYLRELVVLGITAPTETGAVVEENSERTKMQLTQFISSKSNSLSFSIDKILLDADNPFNNLY